MKKLFVALLSLALVGALMSCDSTPIDETADTTDTPAETVLTPDESTLEITASVKDLTRTGLTLVLSYTGEPCDAELSTGSQFHLEKYTGGKWARLETLEPEEEYGWTAIAYLIPCTDDPVFSEIEIETYWSHMYGSLADGRYRVVKSVGEFRGVGNVTSHNVYAEFVINETVE